MRDLQNQSNITPPTADYPNGRIKDDDGSGNGTPVDEAVYGDVNQFLMKLARDAGIIINDLPDNSTNGFQLNDALSRLPGRYGLAYNGHFDYKNVDTAIAGATQTYDSLYSDDKYVYYGSSNNGIAWFMVKAEHGDLAGAYSPFPTGSAITAICSDKDYYYVARDGVEITAWNKETDVQEPGRTIPIAYNVAAMEVQGNEIYIADTTNDVVKVYTASSGAFITDLAVGLANVIDISVSGNKLYCAVNLSTNINVYDTENGINVVNFSIGGITAKSISVYGNTIHVLAGSQVLTFAKSTYNEDLSQREQFYGTSSNAQIRAGGNYMYWRVNAANWEIREFAQVMDRV